jgi:threonine synthase
VTVAAAEVARRRGVIRDADEVVALVTGNGLKTPEARLLGLPAAESGASGRADDGALAGTARPGEPGLAPILLPRLEAFESWLEGRA